MSEPVGDLIDFGLTPLQSRVYISLLRLGQSRAGRLSSAAGVVRPEVYRILRTLIPRTRPAQARFALILYCYYSQPSSRYFVRTPQAETSDARAKTCFLSEFSFVPFS